MHVLVHHVKDIICFLLSHTNIYSQSLRHAHKYPDIVSFFLAFKCLSSSTFHLPLYFNTQNFTELQERKACMRFLHSTIARKTSIKRGLRRKDHCFYYWPLCQLWSAITGLIRECCLCRLRLWGLLTHTTHSTPPARLLCLLASL